MNKLTQRPLKLTLDPNPSEPKYLHRSRQRLFDNPPVREHFTGPEKFAQILKRQSRSVLENVTRCAPHAIGIHLAQLRDVCELIDFAVASEMIPEPERFLSGLQLAHPHTVMDLRACLDHAKQYHRMPPGVTSNEEIITRLDLMAAQLMKLNSVKHASIMENDSDVDANVSRQNGGGL